MKRLTFYLPAEFNQKDRFRVPIAKGTSHQDKILVGYETGFSSAEAANKWSTEQVLVSISRNHMRTDDGHDVRLALT